MSFAALLHPARRWPNGRVPFVIDPTGFPNGSPGWQAITQAVTTWNTSVIVQLQPRQLADNDYVSFEPAPASNFSKLGRVGGKQVIGCALPATNVVPQNARFALANQREGLLVGAFIGTDGGLWITWVEGLGEWEGPIRIDGSAGLFPPGGDVALVPQGDGF